MEVTELPVLQALFMINEEDVTERKRQQLELREESEDGEEFQRCLCKRENNCLMLSMESGAVHYIPLPFLVRNVIALSAGLLIERDTMGETGNGALPIFFSLLHPMSDLCPVSIRRHAPTTPAVSILGYMTDTQLHIVGSSRVQRDLLLVYNEATGTHSIWETKPATAEDIPSHVNTPHHQKRNHNSTITPTPHSTSAPSQYDLRQPPHRGVDTPVQMVFTGNKKSQACHLQKPSPYPFSGGGKGAAPGKRGSGWSPFVTRLQTPIDVASQKRSKSVSPLLGRLSPFSQTVNSNTWSTVYSEESALSLEPLLPQLCLHQLVELEERSPGAASDFFSCGSLAMEGPTYIYFLTPSSAQLWILSAGWTTPKKLDLVSVPATQAVPIAALNVVLVLSPHRELSLYSGTMKVCTLDMEWLFANGDVSDSCAGGDGGWTEEREKEEERRVVGIRGGVDNQFTVELNTGMTLHCILPQNAQIAVKLSVEAIASVLPMGLSYKMLADYYSTCIHLAPTPFSTDHFQTWLLTCLHLAPVTSAPADTAAITQKSLPALALFKSSNYCQSHPNLKLSPVLQLVDYSNQILTVLHLVYEEMKLYSSEADSLPWLACLLHKLATSLGGHERYLDHYHMDHPSLFPHAKMDGSQEERMECGDGREEVEMPPHLMRHLHMMLSGNKVLPFSSLGVCKRTMQILKLYWLYSTPAGGRVPLSSLLSSSVVTDAAVAQWNKILSDSSSPYERVVLGMLAEGLTREDLVSLPVGVALPLWDAVLRCREHAPPTWDLAAYDIIGRHDIVKTMKSSADASSVIMESPDKNDGMRMDQEILKLHFPKDLRVNEVKRMLNSSQPVTIALEQKPEVSDHEFIEQQESTLLAICQRTMSLPVGRGMFTLATSRPLPTSPLAIPHLDLTGKAPPRNSTVGLEHIEKPPNMSVWAEFHNGVAAGLRVSPTVSKLDSTWIISNRPSPPPPPSSGPPSEETPQRHSAHHAGVLLALGLTGHLTALMEYELFEYLHDKHELTTVAILLGITAARVGSMQRSIASILSIFIPSLLPFGAADMEVSQGIQTAALTGMGLLYLGSGNRHLTEVMLREISHVPGPELEFAENRESYSLAAGVALGLITLGRGGNLPGLGDLRLVEQLSLLISGGMKNEVLLGAIPQTSSHLVLEPNTINIHVTSPAATVALGLMFLKTNDSSVASRLDAPNTLYELEYIRSDFYILRSASRGLIMWDDVKPTQDWITSNIPEMIQKKAFRGSLCKGESDDLTAIDYQTLSQAFLCISAGCCMAIGLRYAGTADQQAHTVLMKNIRFLLSKIASSSTAEEAGKQCLDMCLSVVLLSAAMVMSGTGDLEVLRVIRRLHARATNPDVTYGSHMATHMALGLLFLGGCRYSLGRSNRAIASLYAALFPLFPSSSTDSRYHLQALRHLYVLAAEPRVLVTRDVETGQVRSVKVCVRGERSELSASTPCIVPEWTSIREIEICSPDFWPITLNLDREDNKMRQVLAKSGTVFVRRKTGGHKEQLARGSLPLSLSQHVYNTCNVIGKLELSEDNFLRQCSYGPLLSPDITQDTTWQRFLTAALLECVSEEKLPVFPSLLHLDKLSRSVLSSKPPSTTNLWQLKLGWALANRVRNDSFQLLHKQLADIFLLRVKQSLYQYSHKIGDQRMEGVLRAYFVRGGGGEEAGIGEEVGEWLAAVAVVYDIPPRHTLAMTPDTTVPQLLTKVQSLQAPVSAAVCLLPLMKSQLPQPLNLPFLSH